MEQTIPGKGAILMCAVVLFLSFGVTRIPAAPLLHSFPFAGTVSARTKSTATDGSNVVAALYSESLNTMGSFAFNIDGEFPIVDLVKPCAGIPYVAFGRTNFLTVWLRGDTNSLDLQGQFLGSKEFTILAGLANVELKGLSWNGESFLVLWSHRSSGGSSIEGQVLDEAALPIGDVLLLNSPGAIASESAVTATTAHLIVWMESLGPTNEWHTRCRAVSGADVVSDAFTLSSSPALSANPVAIAVGGHGAMAVWNREVGPYRYQSCCGGCVYGTNDWLVLFGRMLAKDGIPIGQEFQVSHRQGSQTEPKCAFDGTNFFVVWSDFRFVLSPSCPTDRLFAYYGQQVSTNGTLVNPQFLSAPNIGLSPDSLVHVRDQFISFTHYNFLVQGRDYIYSIRPANLGIVGFHNFIASSNGYTFGEFTGTVAKGTHYLQVSTNLVNWSLVPWEEIGPGYNVALRPNQWTRWTDPYPAFSGCRFYRSVNLLETCVSNLTMIEQTKAAWAFATAQQSYQTPADSDLFGPGKYLPSKPTCPLGGTYFLNDLASYPSCNMPAAAGHTLY